MPHKINIKPTVHADLKPFNYKIIRRLSRISGVDPKTIGQMFLREYARIIAEARDANQKDLTHLDAYQLSDLYKTVTKRLGVGDNDLVVSKNTSTELNASASPKFEMRSHLSGFGIATAEKYMTEVGYSLNFIQRLKNSPRVELIHYPKYLDAKFKKQFETFFERQILANRHRTEHAVVFYARTVAAFITKLVKDGYDPFSKLIRSASVLPVSALQSLYRYKFNVVSRFAHSVSKFRVTRVVHGKANWASISGRKFQNFNSSGTVFFSVRAKPIADKTLKQQFYVALDEMGNFGKRLHKGAVSFTTEKGVSIIFSIDKTGKVPTLVMRYRIDITPQFTFDGIDNPSQWIEKYVINPTVKEFDSTAMYQGRVKIGA